MEPFNINNGECLDSLRLSEGEQQRLLADFAPDCGDHDDERRLQPRIRYEKHAGLVVQMHHPGGSIATYMVRARNLSRNGIAFFHGGFVHQDTRCFLMLKATDGRYRQIEGRVMRCQHVRKHVHDIGVQFSQPIKLGDFLPHELLTGEVAEVSQEFPRLSGTVLHVDDSVSEQELMRFYLGNLGVEARTASDGLAALELAAGTRFDAIITDVWLPTISGPELAGMLRGQGFTGPIIAITADEREETRADALSHGCTVVLLKPYNIKSLSDALEQYLLPAPEAGQNLISELWGDHRMQPLIRDFVLRMESQIGELERLIQSGRTDLLLRKLCLDIKGAAGGFGYPRISEAAQQLLHCLDEKPDMEAVRRHFGELASLVRSAAAFLSGQRHAGGAPPAATHAA